MVRHLYETYNIRFQSLKGVNYTVKIYKWSTAATPPAIIQLQGADGVFVTKEDDNDDFFTPVRTQTGTLRVVDTNLQLMESLIPSDNVVAPVQLVDNTHSNTVVWYGFLSCESYSQDYISVAQGLELPLLSYLEAMDSVEYTTQNVGMRRIRNVIADVINTMITASGMPAYTDIYFPYTDHEILSQYIDTSIFFDREKYDNEYKVTYALTSITCKEALSRICTYMGWCCREDGSKLFFTRMGREWGMSHATWNDFKTENAQFTYTTQLMTYMDMSSLTYRGNTHQRSINQGARMVDVVCNLRQNDIKIDIPECPADNVLINRSLIYRTQSEEGQTSNNDIMFTMKNMNTDSYSNITHRCYKATYNYHNLVASNEGPAALYDPSSIGTQEEETQRADGLILLNGDAVINRSLVRGPGNPDAEAKENIYPSNLYTFYAGSWLERLQMFDTTNYNIYKSEHGLHCTFFPGMIPSQSITPVIDKTKIGAIFTIGSVSPVTMKNGYLRVQMSMICMGYLSHSALVGYRSFYEEGADPFNGAAYLALGIQVGDYYYTPNGWSNTPQAALQINPIHITNTGLLDKSWVKTMDIDETDGWLIPVQGSTILSGEVKLHIWPMANLARAKDANLRYMSEAFIKSIEVEFIENRLIEVSEKTSNRYLNILNTRFSDEVTINTDLASNLNNKPSPSIICTEQTGSTKMTTITYYPNALSQGVSTRPEHDLLQRMTDFYSLNRRVVELDAEHPTTSLPLIHMTGYDSREYLPLAEERDWQTDTSRITCMEGDLTPLLDQQ